MEEEKQETTGNYLQLQSKIVKELKNVYDPELPVNVYDLGLIYNIDVDDTNNVTVTMTLTAPNCPIADMIVKDVENRVSAVEGVNEAEVNLVFEPQWHQDMMSEEAKLELGLL